MRHLFMLFAVALAIASARPCSADYPAPSGNFTPLRLCPRAADLVNPCKVGALYINELGEFLFCHGSLLDQDNGTWGPMNTVWKQSGNYIFPLDTATNAGLNVGIGTNVPKARLYVATGTAAANAMPITGADLYVLGNIELDGKIYGDGSQLTGISSSQWTTSASNIYYNTGNVGIRTASPTTKLQVAGSNAGTTIGTEEIFSIVRNDGGPTWQQMASLKLGRYVSGGSAAPYTRLDINLKSSGDDNGVANVNVMTLLDNGNVGIGTTAPTIRLEVAGQYASQKYTCTNAVNWNNGNVQYIQLASGSNAAFTFSNPKDGGRYMLILRQPSGGSTATVAGWPGTVLWAGAAVPTLTATLSKTDIISCVYDGTNTQYYCTPVLNF